MLTNLYIRIAELTVTLVLIAAILFAWREARNDRVQLQSQLAAANQALAAATTRQQDRDSKLSDVLNTITKEKSAPASSDQLLAGIAREAGLPTPFSLQSRSSSADSQSSAGAKGNQPRSNPLQPAATPAQTDGNTASATSKAQLTAAPDVKIPAADLRPLYDYMLDCKACQAKLSVAQADERSKTATLTKSRDAAVKAANGGSILQRTLRAAKWFALGAAAGAVAAKARH
jgi:type II secretory pathway pseudopilin PulG